MESRGAPIFGQTRSNVLVFGHRGAKALWPENTMPSFRQALALGVDGLETDVRRTKDGELVLLHDERVDRTTDGHGPAGSFTFAEMRRLNAAVGHDGPAEQIPSLAEFVEWAAGTKLYLNVEFKDYSRDAVDRTVRMLSDAGLLPRCVFTCFSAEVTGYVCGTCGLPTQGFPADMEKEPYEGMERDWYAVGIPMDRLTREASDAYLEQGIDPWCWCPDTDDAVRQAAAAGATLCTCNDPRPALALLRAMGLRR